jgi:hypothetical protein
MTKKHIRYINKERKEQKTVKVLHTSSNLCIQLGMQCGNNRWFFAQLRETSNAYNPDLWLRDPDVVLKYLPTESDGPFSDGSSGKLWSMWQWDKFKYDRLSRYLKLEGSSIKSFPWRFSLSKHHNFPIALGTWEILQKLKSRKIKDCREEVEIWFNSSLLNLKHPKRSRVVRDLIICAGISTRFLQYLKLKNLSSARAPTDSWIVDKLVHRSISRYWRINVPPKSGVFSSFVQPARRRTLKDLSLGALPKSRMTRLVQFCKLKNTSSVRSPIDGCTSSKLMHPVRSSRSRFCITSKHGVTFRFLELLKSILCNLGRHCEARINH